MWNRRSFAGKTALLTGAAGGIGSLVARKLLLDEQCSLLLVDRDGTGLRALKAELDAALSTALPGPPGAPVPTVEIFEVDLSDRSAIDRLVDEVAIHPLDVLINNAAIMHAGEFAAMSLKRFELLFEVNFMAAVRLTHRLLPSLTRARGAIVNVASGAGLVAPAGLLAYAASKFALVGFSEALRAELRGQVTVSTICPAFVATPIVRNSMIRDEEESQSASSVADSQARRPGLEKLDAIVHRIGTPPQKVADSVIAAMKKGEGMVPISAFTRVLWGAKKLAPETLEYLNHLQFRRMLKRLV